jgi:hypothetical protein
VGIGSAFEALSEIERRFFADKEDEHRLSHKSTHGVRNLAMVSENHGPTGIDGWPSNAFFEFGLAFAIFFIFPKVARFLALLRRQFFALLRHTLLCSLFVFPHLFMVSIV